MKQKVKYFVVITVLASIAILTMIVAGSCFALAMQALKKGGGGAIGAFFILVLVVFCIIVGAVLSAIDLPFTIISVKNSEDKRYPILLLVIESIILIIGIILGILIIIKGVAQ